MNKFEKIKFVSIGGSNDTGDGSFELPYKTIQYALSQIEIDELGWRVVLMSGSYYEPNLDLLPNIPLQAMIPNTVTITSPIIFTYNGSYSFNCIDFSIIDNYAFTCTNNLNLQITFTSCGLTAIPTVDYGTGIFNIDNAIFNISIVDSLLSIQNYQALVSIVNTTNNSNGAILLNNCEIKALKNNQIQLDAPILLLNGNTKVITETSKIYGQIQIENNASINANKANFNTSQVSIIVTNSPTTSRLTHCNLDCDTNPVIDGLGTLQIAECCFLNNGTRFSTTLNNNTGIYYLPTTSPRLVDQALPQSIQSGALYYAQGDFYDDRTSRFKIPQADQETGILTPEQLPDAQYGKKGINYPVSVRNGATKKSIIDIEAGVHMEIDTAEGIATFNATGSLTNKVLVELADGTTEVVSKLKQGSNMDWVIEGETVTQSATGGGGESYEIGDGLQTTLNPNTGKEILSTKVNASEFKYNDIGVMELSDQTTNSLTKANTALQKINSGIGIEAMEKTNNEQTINLKTATSTTIGGVKPDNVTTTVDANGAITAIGGGSGSDVVLPMLYKQFSWVNNTVQLTSFDNNIISNSSLVFQSNDDVLYNSSGVFCLSAMMPTFTSSGTQRYKFIGQFCCNKVNQIKFNYFIGDVVQSLQNLQQAQTQIDNMPIYLSNKTYTISNISSNDVVSFDSFAKKITLSLKQQGLTKFKCYYNSVTQKLEMANLGNETFLNTTGSGNLLCIASGIYRGNKQVVSNNNLVFQASDGVPYKNNTIWESDSFVNNDTVTTSNMVIDLGWVKFNCDLSNFANYNSIYNLLIEYNVALIDIIPSDPKYISEMLELPNLQTQNFIGNPYNPTKGIISSYLGNGNVFDLSPIVLLNYNYWDYQNSADNSVTYIMDSSKFKHNVTTSEIAITFNYISPVQGDKHNVRFIFDAKGMNGIINNGSTYYEKIVEVSKFNLTTIEYNNNDVQVYTAQTTFNITINNGIVSISSSNDIFFSASTIQITNWDNTVNYKINNIVANGSGVFRAVSNNLNSNPWLTNDWVAQGNENTYHLTNLTYQATTGVSLIMVEAPLGHDVDIATVLLSNVKTPFMQTIKCCQLTNGNKIHIHTTGLDTFEDGSNMITISDKSDIVSLIYRPGEAKIFFGN